MSKVLLDLAAVLLGSMSVLFVLCVLGVVLEPMMRKKRSFRAGKCLMKKEYKRG